MAVQTGKRARLETGRSDSASANNNVRCWGLPRGRRRGISAERLPNNPSQARPSPWLSPGVIGPHRYLASSAAGASPLLDEDAADASKRHRHEHDTAHPRMRRPSDADLSNRYIRAGLGATSCSQISLEDESARLIP